MTFRRLDSIDVADGTTTRRISLYEGELAAIPAEHRADILVVSAYPNDYTPSETSLLGALERNGLSIGQLASDRAHDLTATCAFWISHAIRGPAANLNIGQVACFEPVSMGSPQSVVGNLFRGLFPFLDDRKSQVVAMPLLAAGDQGFPPAVMLRSILEAATHWLARGLPVTELKIVEHNPVRAIALAKVMADFKATLTASKLGPPDASAFDMFLSYSMADVKAAECVRAAVTAHHTSANIFDFRLKIDKGKSWQDEIDRAISASRSIIALLSPSYFDSPECQEELAQARLRNKRSDRKILIPIYWRGGRELALWLQALNYADCREGDYQKLTTTVTAIASNGL